MSKLLEEKIQSVQSQLKQMGKKKGKLTDFFFKVGYMENVRL